MIGKNSDWDQFVSNHRWAVLTTLRGNGSPVSSVVAYARRSDALLVSTPGTTFKRACLERDPRLNLCVISNREPFNFVSMEGRCRILTEDLETDTQLVFDNIAGTGYPPPEDMSAWLVQQQRVILEFEAERVHGVIR